MLLPPVVARALTPDPVLQIPDEFTRVEVDILEGVPRRIPLNSDWQATFFLPTGLARAWMEAPAATPVSSSVAEGLPSGAPSDSVSTRVRLSVSARGTAAGSFALAANRRHWISPPANIGAQPLEIYIRGWELNAGSVQGPGDFGSHLSFGWRLAGQSVDVYSTPPVDAYAKLRIEKKAEPGIAMQSTPGSRYRLASRFAIRKVFAVKATVLR